MEKCKQNQVIRKKILELQIILQITNIVSNYW